jgi:glutamate synthase (NADPH/NADH) small chain
MRQGCRSLTQIEIVPEFPSSLPWPEFGRTSLPDYGQEEVAAVHGSDPRGYSVTAERFSSDSRGDGAAVTHTRLVDVDWNSGRPQPVSGSGRDAPTQLVLLSMGFLGPEDQLIDQLRLDRDERSNAKAEYDKFTTSLPGVFAAGDVRRGASLVVWAIMEGRGAARECDRYLMGSTLLP